MRALVLGGASSGKTRRALALAQSLGPRRVYVATAQALDDEMAARIAAHRAERDASWRTIEEPLELADLTVEAGDVALIDCLTLWLANLGGAGRAAGPETGRLAAAVARWPGDLVLVSGEVGLGVVPMNALARRFSEDLGRLNQAMARACDRVELVVAGLPLVLKG